MRYESVVRPPELQFTDWLQAQWTKIEGALDAFEQEAAGFGGEPTIGTVAIACALGYLDLRFNERGWRNARPALTAFHADFAARPSYTATAPPA